MIICWTTTEFLLQWIWVALIILCACLFFIMRIKRMKKYAGKNRNPSCDGCPMCDSCSADECDSLKNQD